MTTAMFNQAMSYLSQGICSEHLLCTYLEKDYPDEPHLQERIKETLGRLHQLELIQDIHIARRMALSFSHKGNGFIKNHLEKFGFKTVDIQSALAFIGSEYTRALKAAQIKCITLDDLNSSEAQTQIMRLLSSRSFSYHTVQQVISTLFNSPGSRQALNVQKSDSLDPEFIEA